MEHYKLKIMVLEDHDEDEDHDELDLIHDDLTGMVKEVVFIGLPDILWECGAGTPDAHVHMNHKGVTYTVAMQM